MPDLTPEERLKGKVDEATEHAGESLATYAEYAKSMAGRLASPGDADQSMTADIGAIWAQMMKDTAYGWLTLYGMAQDVRDIKPTQADPAAETPE